MVAELLHEGEIAERACIEGGEIDGLEVDAEIDAAHLRHRVAELDAAAERIGGVRSDGEARGVGLALVDVEALAHAVDRVVRVEVGERIDLVHRAAVDVERQELAGAEDVRLRERGRQSELFHAREADAEKQCPRGPLLHRIDDVHLVGVALDRHGLDVHFAEVLRAVDAPARELDLRGVVVGALELAHLAPYHLVARLGIAGDVDAAHVHPPARIDDDVERHRALFLVHLGDGVGVGERVAFVAQPVGDRLGARRQLLARKDVAGLELHQLLDLRPRHDQVARHLDLGHRVLLALDHVHRDVDVAPIGRDRHLRRLDREVEVAAVLVESAQVLEVAGELLARIAIGLGVPGEPAGRAQHELAEQLLLRERLGAHQIDAADLGDVAFRHRDVDADAVALERRDGGLHLGA